MANEQTLFMPLTRLWEVEHLPCFVFDEAGIAKTAEQICGAFAWNRDHRQYFPVHCLPNPSILRILHRAGMGVVCTNETELLIAQRAEITDIIYSPIALNASAAKLAASMGCQLLLDNVNQIMGMERYQNLPEVVGLRYNPDERLTSGHRTLAKTEGQGLGMAQTSIRRAIAILKSKGVHRIGLHAHFADQCEDGAVMVATAKLLMELAITLRREEGIEVAYCDISGCFGNPHHLLAPDPNLSKLSDALQKLYQELLKPVGLEQLPLRTQFGGYAVARHGIFAAKITDAKQRHWRFWGLDASAGQLSCKFSPEDDCPVQVLKQSESSVFGFYHAYGASYTVSERLLQHQFLPTAEIGDILVMERMGANMGESPCATYLYTQDGQLRLIRRPPRPEDILASFPEF